ncbi:PKD domain-containing protein [Polaribacter sp. L3A8]|uniref:PKD domain-containing protein n=1 Tax=Polaribacter sp. L3A8 TaxID=2686361 RepID=UPI00131C7D88|nr:PKD domain-containing protein [Polaribacter sp. L3A8]
MKIKKPLSFNHKRKIYYISFLLICGVLLNTYADLSNTKLVDFLANVPISVSGSTKNTIKPIVAPTVSFTFTNNNNACSGEEIQFTSDVSGATGDLTYSWDFGDGITSDEENPIHIFEALGCSSIDFDVTLTVTDDTGTSDLVLQTISVLEKPDVEFGDVDGKGFNKCDNTSSTSADYPIQVKNISDITALSCVNNISIDWGDGTSGISNATFPISHTYTSVGSYLMKITAEGNNGCKNEKIYTVSNSSNLVGGFSLPAIKGTQCAPEYNFAILNWGENSDDTEYTVDFGDGEEKTFTHAQLKSIDPTGLKDFPVIYNYTKGSCPTADGKYTAKLTVKNACYERSWTIDNIFIIQASIPDFETIDRGCINESISFKNISTILDNLDCKDEAKFTWNFGDGTPEVIETSKTTESHTFTTPGTYTVSLTVQGTCNPVTITKKIEILDKPVITNTDLTQEICSTESIAEINLTANITGTTFSWTATASSTDITGFTASGDTDVIPVERLSNGSDIIGFVTYTVTPRSDICDGEPVEFVITVNPAPVFTSQPASSEICLDGTATLLEVEHKNGTGTPTYQWFSNTSNSAIGGTPVGTDPTFVPPTNAAGTTHYYVEVTFPTGVCAKITSNVAKVVVVPQLIVDSVSLPQTICIGGTTPLEITYTNGTGTPSYKWFSNTSNTNTGGTEVAVTTDNTYTPDAFTTNGDFYFYVEISLNGNGCSSNVSEPFKVTVIPDPIIITQPIVSQEVCQGATTLTPLTVTTTSETSSDKNYQWYKNEDDNNTTGTAIAGATFATHTPTTTDDGTFYYYVVVSQPESGCSITSDTSKLIINPTPIITDQPDSYTLCLGEGATALEVVYDNGTGTLEWFSNTVNSAIGGTSVSTKDTYTPSVDVPGTIYYYVKITFPPGGCSSDITSEVASVTVNETPVITLASKQDISCFGDTTGSIDIDVSGGSLPYTYSWTTTDGSGLNTSVEDQTTLTSGTYNVIVTDKLGCSRNQSIVIEELSSEIEVTVAKTNIDPCIGSNFGTIDLTVTGGITPYKISWSNLANGFSLTNLPADTYVATITDANNCEKIVSIEITQTNFAIAPDVTPITCIDANNATISLNLTGDTTNVTVLWNDDAGAGVNRTGLSPGTYTVNIEDTVAGGCPIEETFIITNPSEITVSETLTDDTDCNIVGNGSIALSVFGGQSPYTYLWDTGEITPNLANLPAGDYSVEITDTNGCTIIKQFNIFRQEPLDLDLEETVITDCGLATVSHTTIAKITGGISPYTYEWSDGTTDTNFTTTESGTYTLKITDANGCTKSETITVNLPKIDETDFNYNSSTLETYNLLSIQDPIQFQYVSLSTSTYSSITWDFGDGSPIVRDEEAPSYTYDKVGTFKVTLKIIYGTGCAITKEYDLNITTGYLLISPTAFTPNNDGYNETIRPSFRGLSEIEMTIYNTWGIAIYTEKDIDLELKGWDGTIKGVPSENGNYIMVVKALTFYNKAITTSTPITLIK